MMRELEAEGTASFIDAGTAHGASTLAASCDVFALGVARWGVARENS